MNLILYSEGEEIYISAKGGLRPLIECIRRFQGHTGCTLYDKVIGLAAARLIAYSGIASKLRTTVISKPALKYLHEKGIHTEADSVVPNILTKDRSAVCPGERKAEQIPNEKIFYEHMMAVYSDMEHD